MDNSMNKEVSEPTDTKEIVEETDGTQIDTTDSVQPNAIPSSDSTQPADNSMENLMDLYEESFKRFQEGEVVTGRIISVDKDYVCVDIGYKSEGQIRIQEFFDETGTVTASVGDVVEVMVEWWDDDEEVVVLSKEKAATVKIWEEIKKAYESNGSVQGVITNRVKGGFSVDIGVNAFLPGSQADLRPIRNMDDMVGQTFDFKILKYNRKRSNIVLSRRVLLEEERESKRAETLASISEGKVVEGVVKNITDYGVFIDL
jgi:small subunit ribosomal protein S1